MAQFSRNFRLAFLELFEPGLNVRARIEANLTIMMFGVCVFESGGSRRRHDAGAGLCFSSGRRIILRCSVIRMPTVLMPTQKCFYRPFERHQLLCSCALIFANHSQLY
jgi:hypothetical protein